MATDNPIRPLVLDTEDFMKTLDKWLGMNLALVKRMEQGRPYMDEKTLVSTYRGEVVTTLDNLITDRINAALAAKGIQ